MGLVFFSVRFTGTLRRLLVLNALMGEMVVAEGVCQSWG